MISSRISGDFPTTGLFSYWMGRLWLRIWGWRVTGEIPSGNKFVLIGAPHTSNWDFPIGLAVVHVFRLKVSWMGKQSLFRWPFGNMMKWLGGFPVDRENPEGLVDQIATRFRDAEKFVVAITPSGTRSNREYWKSGFYRIAMRAQVPILCGYMDYGRKEARIGLSFLPTGNMKEDMDRIRQFYSGIRGKYPEVATQIRLREEARDEN